MSGDSKHIPDYYPSGFDYDRLVNCTWQEYADISDTQLERFHTGFIEDRGLDAYVQYRADRQAAEDLISRAEADPEELAAQDSRQPDYVRAVIGWTDWPNEEMPEWGFIVFRTAGYGKGTDEWARAKPILDEIFDSQFKEDVEHGARGAREAQQKFRICWVEGLEWEGASPERCAEHYRKLDDSYRMHHALFLCINDVSLQSLLATPHSLPAVVRERMDAVMILAIASSCGCLDGNEAEEEPDQYVEDTWCGYFYLEIWNIVEELFPALATQSLSSWEIGGGVSPNQIFMDISHYRPLNVEKPYRL